jgi:hypothetical protein
MGRSSESRNPRTAARRFQGGEKLVKSVGKHIFLSGICALLAAGLPATIAQIQQPKQIHPKRLNQAIELLAEGQPVYYTGSHSGTNGTYEQGLKDSQTYADYISYDMEDAPYDIKGLQD